MVAFTHSSLKRLLPPVGALIAGVIAALIAVLMPTTTLEDLVWNSGIAAILPVAAPPLGVTARALLALGGGVLVGAVTWSALFLLFGPDGVFDSVAKRKRPMVTDTADHAALVDVSVPTLRRADAHPDAPARRPLSAKDLGVPMPPVARPTVRDLPADLDQPLAAFDPAAVPASPREPVRPVAPLKAPALAKGERMTSVELPRMPSQDGEAPSIETLLRRLEQGTRPPRRGASR